MALNKPKCNLVTYSGHKIKPEGETTIQIDGQDFKFQVVNKGHPILGKDACVRLNKVARIDALDTIKTTHRSDGCMSEQADKMVSEFKDVFHGLGLIKSDAVIHTDPNIIPVVDPPRRIPFAIQHEVKKEIDRM